MSIFYAERYSNNIRKLRNVQTDIADMINATEVPDTISSATGRDGSVTFLIPSENGTSTWLGRSSMPTISAKGILSNYCYEGGNVALPGVLTGVEIILLAGRLPNYAAIFVIEDCPLHIKLVFQLHDFTHLISGGRLVFILQDDLESNMRSFIQDHPGYEPPRHLLKVPQCSPVQTIEMQRRLECAGERVVEVQAEYINNMSHSIRDRCIDPIPNTPRMALMSADVRPQAIDYAQRITRALDQLGWSYQCCVPDRPDRCHVIERLRAIDRSSADVILHIHSGAETLRSLLPDDLPLVTWYLHDTDISHCKIKEIGPNDMIIVSSKSMFDGLINAGLSATQLLYSVVATDHTVFHPISSSGDKDSSDPTDGCPMDVAVLMNLPNDDPHACGIHLTSHQKLWRLLQQETARIVDDYHAGMAEGILEKAQGMSGTTFRDQQVRDHFLALLRAHIAPAALGRAAARALVDAGCRVRVWGSHWLNDGSCSWESGGAIPSGHALNRLFHAAKIVVLPEHSLNALQTSLDALCAGVHVIYRCAEQSWAEQYAELASIMPYIHGYHTRSELTDAVRQLLSSGEWQDKLQTARAVILKEHTVTKRITMIVDRLRARQQHVPAATTSTHRAGST